MRLRSTFTLALLATAACGAPQGAHPGPVANNQLPPHAAAAAPDAGPSLSATPDAPFRAHAPEAQPTTAFVPPRIEDFRLSNGVRVLLVERHDLPIVVVRYLTRRGADDAPANEAGLASLTGGLLEQGAGRRDALALSDAFAALGADHGAGLSWDGGGGYVKVLAQNLGPALELLADVVERPTFPPRELELARGRRLALLRQERDVPGIIAGNLAARTVFGDTHPYGRSLSGNEASVRALTRADVQRFYRSHFVPADSALVVVGDTTRAAATPLLEQTFGRWRATAPAARPVAAPSAPAAGPRIFLVDRPGSPQAQVSVAQVGVSRATPDYPALVVMNTILGGMFSSRINLNLREAHAYTYGASSGFAFRRGAGPFSAGGAIATPHTADAVRELFHELARIRDADVTEAELTAAKARITETLPARFETTDQTSSAVADLFLYELPLDEYATIAARINAVTAQDVRRVAQRYLDPDHARIVVVGDRQTVEPALAQLELGPVELRDPVGEPASATPAAPNAPATAPAAVSHAHGPHAPAAPAAGPAAAPAARSQGGAH